MDISEEFKKGNGHIEEFDEESYQLYMETDQNIIFKNDNAQKTPIGDKVEPIETDPTPLPESNSALLEKRSREQLVVDNLTYASNEQLLPKATDDVVTPAEALEVKEEDSSDISQEQITDLPQEKSSDEMHQVIQSESAASVQESTNDESVSDFGDSLRLSTEAESSGEVTKFNEASVENNEGPENVESGVEEMKVEAPEEISIEEVNDEDSIVEAETVDIQPVIDEKEDMVASQSEGEFTIVESTEDSDPSEVIILETEASPADDSDNTERSIEVIELTEISQPEEEPEKKSDLPNPNLKNIKIPQHVLGRNMEKPVDDKFSNGRVPPKPRLGVKIPYRNLTSQIVSKQEIEHVIIERARLKNATHDPPVGGDLFFAKKLTQRLAKKIAPSVTPRKEVQNKGSKEKEAVIDNSDLIAILEGDGDDWEVPQPAKAKVDEECKKKEKEIALKQLEQMPNRRGRSSLRVDSAQKKGGSHLSKSGLPAKTAEKLQELQKKHGITIQKAKSDGQEVKIQNGSESKEDDIEPRFSTNSVVKTYTRKRKPSDAVAALAKMVEADVSPKKPMKVSGEQRISIDLPSASYVTKSSRVIKKKVIWDPDEAASPIKKNKSPRLEMKVVKVESKATAAKEAKEEEKSEPVKAPVQKEKVIPTQKEKKIIQKSPEEKPSASKSSSSLKKSKRLTEIDRLLMDEGAVNMLYDVKNTEDNLVSKQKKRKLSTISIDKAERELLNKTKEIKNDLQSSSNRQSPKSLRKKESFASIPSTSSSPLPKKEVHPGAITRKKSKDSNRSSVHSPPASPAFYQNAEASRIIRRHSSSSFSSDGEEGDAPSKESGSVKSPKKKPGMMDKMKKKEVISAADKAKLNEEMAKSFSKAAEPVKKEAEQYGAFKSLKIKLVNNVAQITLQQIKKESLLSVQALNELTEVLNQLEEDNNCHVVAFCSHTRSFCHGLDYRYLNANAESRKTRAEEMAHALRTFLNTLASFSKFLGAAVDGNVVGVGVTMLPLFDMVLASDRATFSVPSGRLGCSEAGSHLLALPHLSNCAVTCELLYSGQKISADDAASHGLVTRTLLPEKFHEQAVSTLEVIANQSQQSVRATKKLLRRGVLPGIQADLEFETVVLVEQWISEECQKNFAKYRAE